MNNKVYKFQKLDNWKATTSPSQSEDSNYCYTPETAYLILNTGLDYIDLVVHKDRENYWRVSEYLTGGSIHYISRETPKSRRDIVEWAIAFMLKTYDKKHVLASINKNNHLNKQLNHNNSI